MPIRRVLCDGGNKPPALQVCERVEKSDGLTRSALVSDECKSFMQLLLLRPVLKPCVCKGRFDLKYREYFLYQFRTFAEVCFRSQQAKLHNSSKRLILESIGSIKTHGSRPALIDKQSAHHGVWTRVRGNFDGHVSFDRSRSGTRHS